MKAEYINHMGDDLMVVNAAKVSFDKASDWERQHFNPVTREEDVELRVMSEKDERLIAYLARHNHWTPFAHPQITLRMDAPVPIRTQCFKHKQGFVENEQSRRYISSTPDIHIPDVFRSAPPKGGAKQGSGEKHYKSVYWRGVYLEQVNRAVHIYEAMIADGVCPEQARFVLPQGARVQWYWTGSLAAYARFYGQRTDPHAQEEVRVLAQMVSEIIVPLFPVSWKALTE